MNISPACTLVVADDHQLVRLGIASLAAQHASLSILGEAADGEQALEMVQQLRPRILLLDLNMPKRSGLEVLRALTADSSITTKVLVLTSHIDTRGIREALSLGVRGVLLKSDVATRLIEAIEAVMSGEYFINGQSVTNVAAVLQALTEQLAGTSPNTIGLSPRELEVVALVAQGAANQDIADALKISQDTVKRHLTNAFDKTGVSSRLELALFALHHGLTGNSPDV